MSARRADTGRRGEDMAARALERMGYRIVARNWRAGRTGELDLVAVDGGALVIVEVKTARGDEFGDPLGWITPAKTRQIARLAEAFLAAGERAYEEVRFDVVAVNLAVNPPTVRHLVDAFRPEHAQD